MSTDPNAPAETLTANVAFTVGTARIQAEITVPKRPVPLSDLLPVFRSLADSVIGRAIQTEHDEGKSISCRAGCGACCRQLVPISEIEARQIRDLVESLPEPRRAEVRARFETARKTLDEAGMLEKLTNPEHYSDDELRGQRIGIEYFRLGIPCPFLEDESCSIHPVRPIACREYLVTSPRENCKNPTIDSVDGVELPNKVSTALNLVGVDTSRRFVRWVPLILAPEWAESHPDDLGDRPGPEWIRELFSRLTGREIPPPPK